MGSKSPGTLLDLYSSSKSAGSGASPADADKSEPDLDDSMPSSSFDIAAESLGQQLGVKDPKRFSATLKQAIESCKSGGSYDEEK